MIDLGSLIAVGLSGFLAGMAFATRESAATLRASAKAGCIVVDERGYYLEPLDQDGGSPPPDPGELVVIQGGRERAA